jgi:hypothetical protein
MVLHTIASSIPTIPDTDNHPLGNVKCGLHDIITIISFMHTKESQIRSSYFVVSRSSFCYTPFEKDRHGSAHTSCVLEIETQAELDSLLPSILDKAFKGELV